ncbi:MAG: nucleotidyltransferase family protein [Pyrinomonadaceae bacterium]|nr:nucleotidyltransferase family protein [Pyrinomonadaceae bacterium]
MIHFRVHELKLIKLFEQLKGFDPILIKGWATAQFFPKSHTRTLGDFDIVIDPNRADDIVRYEPQLSGSLIDLHIGLRNLDSAPWSILFDGSIVTEKELGSIRILSPEDHLRVVCVHWLTDGGENRHRLWDIYYMVKNRPADFDWDRCLNVVSKRRRRWIVCTIGLAHRYLGLDLRGTPIEEDAKDLPKWLTKRVEKEWKRNIPLIPLSQAKHSWKTFLQQIWKRLPPNPIMATIDCEGDFDSRTRIIYQIRDIVKRFRMRREREGKR